MTVAPVLHDFAVWLAVGLPLVALAVLALLLPWGRR